MKTSPPHTASATRQFLVDCLRPSHAREETPDGAVPAEAVDWELFMRLVAHHRLTALLDRFLEGDAFVHWQRAERSPIAVGGEPGVGAQPPFAAKRVALEQAKAGVGVADVDYEEHGLWGDESRIRSHEVHKESTGTAEGL